MASAIWAASSGVTAEAVAEVAETWPNWAGIARFIVKVDVFN